MLRTLKIKFNKESFFCDVLTCTAYATETTNNYVHKITKDGVSVCDIETLWGEITDEANIADYDLSLTKK